MIFIIIQIKPILQYLMKLLSKLREAVLKFDLFCTTQYFRYKQQPEYRTLTGGICSIVIIIVFVIVFSSSVLSTFDKQTIIWQYGLTQQTSNQFDITANTEGNPKFMFALGVNGLDLTSNPKLFDFSLSQQTSIKGNVTSQSFTLQPCQRKHWEGAGQKILEIYDRLNFSNNLCPPVNTKFNITGMKSSSTWKYLKMTVSQCKNTSNNFNCAPNTTLLKYLQEHPNFNFNIYFINGLINPSSPQEISYYLEDRNFVPFNYNYGGEVNLFMSKYQIQTDQEILPFNNVRVSSGGLVNNVGQYIASRKFGSEFATINIKKSSLSLNIEREYIKLDSALSYIGGLFGFIIILFVFMKVYTEYSYEIQMGDQLYFYDKNNPLNSEKFNFFTFIVYMFYQLLSLIGCNFQWNLMKKYRQCRQEIQKQFDISFLMKRLIFLERSLRVLFQDHQFKGLHLHQKLTLKQAEQLRSFYKLRDKLENILIEEVSDSNQGDKHTTKKQRSDDSNLINVTQNILANEQIRHQQSSNFDTQYINNVPKKSVKVQNKSQIQLEQKRQGNNNDSEVMIRPVTTMRNNRSRISRTQKHNSTIQKKINILRKESLSGNKISKKIYEGFNTELIKNILLKIEEANEQPESPQKNEIVINQNEEQFEIRISKRVIRPRNPSIQQQAPIDEIPNSPINIQEREMASHQNNKISNEFEYIQ